MRDLALLGHDCPLGEYPSPVVPIVARDSERFAVYVRANRVVLQAISSNSRFVLHAPKTRDRLRVFDHRIHQLFALDSQTLQMYLRAEETDFFRKILRKKALFKSNPFLGLSLAKESMDPRLLAEQIQSCTKFLAARAPSNAERWYQETVPALVKRFPALAAQLRSEGTAPDASLRHAQPSQRKGGGHAAPIATPMTGAAIYAELSESTGLTRKQVKAVFEELGSLIERHLRRRAAGTFTLPGLLKIQTVRAPARKVVKGASVPFKSGTGGAVQSTRVRVKVLPLKRLKEMPTE